MTDPVTIRAATVADNGALLALSEACTARAQVSIRVRRGSDFFALNRLEGDWWRVLVAETADRGVVGCLALACRSAFLNGQPRPVLYSGDLKVHPTWRGRGLANLLIEEATSQARAIDPDLLTLVAVLRGNAAMAGRMAGRTGAHRFQPAGAVVAHTIPLVWLGRGRPATYRVTRGREADLDAIAACWHRIAPGRQFSAAHDPESLARWIHSAPGLAPESYWIAHRRDGRIAGVVAFWDQRPVKETIVVGYSRPMAVARQLVNAAARLCHGPHLPAPGEPLRAAVGLHLAVPPDEPAVLGDLVRAAAAEYRRDGLACLLLGLDARDPAAMALPGLGAFRTVIDIGLTTPRGRWTGPVPDGRLLHLELALV